jgi:hypothetical protein
MNTHKTIAILLLACAPFTWAENTDANTPKIASTGTTEATTGLSSGDFAIANSLNGAQVILYSLVVAGVVTWVSYDVYKNATKNEPSSTTGTR